MQKIAYQYRIYPTKAQEKTLDKWIELCRQLYNVALEQRIQYKNKKKYITFIDQIKQLKEFRDCSDEYLEVPSHVLQNVLYKLDTAFKRFYERCKKQKQGIIIKAGFPKFKPRARYKSITSPDPYTFIKGNKFHFPLIGLIKFRQHRKFPDCHKVKTFTISKKCNEWFITFVLDIPNIEPINNSGGVVGLDCGVENFATLSDSKVFKQPKFYEKVHKQIDKAQKIYRRRKPGSKRKEKQLTKLGKIYLSAQRKKIDFQRKLASRISKEYSKVFVEDLHIKKMVKSGGKLAKKINESSWGTFISYLESSVVKNGSQLIKVNPANTSKMCSSCGNIVEKSIFTRVHECSCGLKIDRDLNAAKNILALGLRQDVPKVTPEERRPSTFRYKRKACHLVESGTTIKSRNHHPETVFKFCIPD